MSRTATPDAKAERIARLLEADLNRAIRRVLGAVERLDGDVPTAAWVVADVLRTTADRLEGLYPRT
jgi:hypothetical protein